MPVVTSGPGIEGSCVTIGPAILRGARVFAGRARRWQDAWRAGPSRVFRPDNESKGLAEQKQEAWIGILFVYGMYMRGRSLVYVS